MSFFDFLKGPDINQGVKEYSTTDGAVLLDVRTPDEYRQGHIPGSKNVPLQSIDKVAGMIDNKATPIFVHCLSGARSRQAAAVLQQLADCRKTLGELERAKALSNFNRAQRHVRWAREDFCGGKSHFPEQKSFPCSFCARKSERFQQKLVGVAGRLKTQRVFRFRRRRNCRRLKPKI